MKRIVPALIVAVLLIFSIGAPALAAHHGSANGYYDADGNAIYGRGMYYGGDGTPMFGRGCYYYDADGNTVSAYGCPVYGYDGEGNLIASRYCYDDGGNVVYPRGYGRGFGRGGCCRSW